MIDPNKAFEADIIHELPDDLSALIGRIMVGYARLEYNLTALSALLLQLNKAESRIALRTPRAVERLDMALDLFAIKAIEPSTDTTELRALVEKASQGRDAIAHGIWLSHPETGELWLRLARGSWPKDKTQGAKIPRAIYPQSIPFGVEQCRETLATVTAALERLNDLGADLSLAQQSYPDRFRSPAPNLNPLGYRRTREPPTPRAPFGGDLKP
jgi:hypothetical protein